ARRRSRSASVTPSLQLTWTTDMSERGRDAPRRVASEIHGNRQAGDVGWIDLDVHAERGDASAESLRADAEIVDAFEQLAFQPAEIRARMTDTDRPQDRFLREERGRFERSSDADADDDRRTGVCAGAIDGLEHE